MGSGMKFRILKKEDRYGGVSYRVQRKYWFWPFWIFEKEYFAGEVRFKEFALKTDAQDYIDETKREIKAKWTPVKDGDDE